MRLHAMTGALALSTAAMGAFTDSSPWLLFSTSKFQESPNPRQIQANFEVVQHARDILDTCPTERYLVISQPGVRGVDLGRTGSCAMPRLCRAIEDARVKSRFTVAEVVGTLEHPPIAEHVREACARKNKIVTVDHVDLASIPRNDRASALSNNDATLADRLDGVTSGNSYTIVFYSPPAEPVYESLFEHGLHVELKRDVYATPMRRQENDTERHDRSLFDKYQFFTPGIFMGIVVTLILLIILSVGLSALSSLQVSYAAFEKENGPAAHRKLQ